MIYTQHQRPSLISSPANSIGDDNESQDILSEPTVVSPGMYSEEDVDSKPNLSSRDMSDDGHGQPRLEAAVLPNNTEGSSSPHSPPNGSTPIELLHYQQPSHSDSMSSDDSANRVSLPGFTSIFGDAPGQHPAHRRAPSAGLEGLKQSEEYAYYSRRSSIPFSGASTQLRSLQNGMNVEWQQASANPSMERQQNQQAMQSNGGHDSKFHGRMNSPDSIAGQFTNHALAPLSSPSFAGASASLPSHSAPLSPSHTPLSNITRPQYHSKPSSKNALYSVSDSGGQQWSQRAGFSMLTASLPSPPINGGGAVKTEDAINTYSSKPLPQGMYNSPSGGPSLPPPPQTQHLGYAQQAQHDASLIKQSGLAGSQTTLVVPPAAAVPYPVLPPGTSPPSHLRPEVPQAPRRRGKLPKQVTETLRTWLLDHADHPYPTEEEKKMLCAWTGLSISQVSNWMINARRRILVPASKAAVGPAVTSAPYNLAHRPMSAASQMAGTANMGPLNPSRTSSSMYGSSPGSAYGPGAALPHQSTHLNGIDHHTGAQLGGVGIPTNNAPSRAPNQPHFPLNNPMSFPFAPYGQQSSNQVNYGGQSYGMPSAGLSMTAVHHSSPSGNYGQAAAHNGLPPPHYSTNTAASPFSGQSHHDAPGQAHHRIYY